jgi:DNA-binding NarL/FixJ family response regulator
VTVIDNNTQEHSTRILLVEDHASFRQALAFMFAREGEFAVASQAGSLAEARLPAQDARRLRRRRR